MHHNLPDMERVGCGRRMEETLLVRRWRRSLSVQRVCEDFKGRERRERTGESLGIRLGMKWVWEKGNFLGFIKSGKILKSSKNFKTCR